MRGPVRAVEGSIIYYGPMGQAGYQGVIDRMQPLRPLDPRFDGHLARFHLALLSWLQPRLRSWFRCRRWRGPSHAPGAPAMPEPDAEISLWSAEGRTRDDLLPLLLADGWRPGDSSDAWDLQKDGSRLVLATERGDGIGKHILIRIWGDRSLLASVPGLD